MSKHLEAVGRKNSISTGRNLWQKQPQGKDHVIIIFPTFSTFLLSFFPLLPLSFNFVVLHVYCNNRNNTLEMNKQTSITFMLFMAHLLNILTYTTAFHLEKTPSKKLEM